MEEMSSKSFQFPFIAVTFASIEYYVRIFSRYTREIAS